MSEGLVEKFRKSITNLGFQTLDIYRKIFFVLMFGTSSFINLLIRPRISLLYQNAGLPLATETIYISYLAMIGMLIFAFIPLKKTATEFFKYFVTSLALGLVLMFLAMSSVIIPIYTLISILK